MPVQPIAVTQPNVVVYNPNHNLQYQNNAYNPYGQVQVQQVPVTVAVTAEHGVQEDQKINYTEPQTGATKMEATF